MKILYNGAIQAKCDDSQVATLLASGWTHEPQPRVTQNADEAQVPKQVPKQVRLVQVPKQVPIQKPAQRVQVTQKA